MASGRTPLSSTAKPHQDTTASSVRARRHRLRAAESFVQAPGGGGGGPGQRLPCLPAPITIGLFRAPPSPFWLHLQGNKFFFSDFSWGFVCNRQPRQILQYYAREKKLLKKERVGTTVVHLCFRCARRCPLSVCLSVLRGM